MSQSISVVIMAYNEAANIRAVSEEILGALERLGQEHEVIIINDGSTDDTELAAQQIALENSSVRIISHASNLGLGGVYRTGFAEAKRDLITFFPADGQFPASILSLFVPMMGEYDMVLGYLPKRQSSLIARLLSRAERVLYRLLFGEMPEFQGILMFKRQMLAKIPLRSTGRGWAILIELIYRAARGKYKLCSIPTEMKARLSGRSKVNNFRTIVSNVMQALALRRYL